MIKVGVIGAAGRMGAAACAAIAAADGLQLVAAVDATQGVTAEGVTISKELRALADAHAHLHNATTHDAHVTQACHNIN